MNRNVSTARRGWMPLLALLVLLCLAIASGPAEATPSNSFQGTITRVGGDQITLKVMQADMSFQVMPEATITLNGNRVMLESLPIGCEAEITAERLDDDLRLAMNIAATGGDGKPDNPETTHN